MVEPHHVESERESDVTLRGSYCYQFTCHTKRTQIQCEAISLFNWVLYSFESKLKKNIAFSFVCGKTISLPYNTSFREILPLESRKSNTCMDVHLV